MSKFKETEVAFAAEVDSGEAPASSHEIDRQIFDQIEKRVPFNTTAVQCGMDEIRRRLVVSGHAMPILEGDWSVSRMMAHSAELVGIRSWRALQGVLLREYAVPEQRPVHLHKGPGNGQLMEALRAQDPQWDQVGIADRLYFNVEYVLKKFVRPKTRYSPQLLKILGLAIRRTLKEECRIAGTTTNDLPWQPSTNPIDLNRIYALLQSPAELISKLYIDDSHSTYLDSVEFEADERVEFEPKIQAVIERGFKALNQDRFHDFLRELFTDEFVECIDNPESRVDLNRLADASPEGFVWSYFKDIKKNIRDGSVLLMSAIRSDSHETSDDFQRDIRNNLRKLQPGGVLVTDGTRQSYTRFIRLEEVREALKDHPDCQARVLIGESIHGFPAEPLGVIIQRSHPERTSLWADTGLKKACFREGIELFKLDRAIQRPDQKLMGLVLPRVLDLADSETGVNVYHGLHNAIHSILYEVLIDATIERLKQEEDTQFLRKRFEIEEDWPIDFEDPQVRKRLLRGILSGQCNDVILWRKKLIERGLVREFASRVRDLGVRRDIPMFKKASPFLEHSIDPTVVRTFRKLDSRVPYASSFNSNEKPRRKSDIPKNEECEDLNEGELAAFREEMRTRFEQWGADSLVIIEPRGCVTNKILEQRIGELLGVDLFGTFAKPVPFSTQKTDIEQITSILKDRLSKGGLIVGGGSWETPPGYHGRRFRNRVTHELVKALKNGAPIGVIGVCYTAQNVANTIGSRFGERKLRTRHGMLEIGPIPLQVVDEAKGHPLLKGLPPQFTVAMTHGWHVMDDRDWHHESRSFLTPIAHVEGTRERAAIWTGFDGRLATFQPHIEIMLPTQAGRLTADINRVCGEIRKKENVLAQDYATSPDELRANWLRFAVQNQAGPRLLMNALRTTSEAAFNVPKLSASRESSIPDGNNAR